MVLLITPGPIKDANLWKDSSNSGVIRTSTEPRSFTVAVVLLAFSMAPPPSTASPITQTIKQLNIHNIQDIPTELKNACNRKTFVST